MKKWKKGLEIVFDKRTGETNLRKEQKVIDDINIETLQKENAELKARLELYTEAINLSIIECNELAKYDQCDTRYETVQELLEQAEAKF